MRIPYSERAVAIKHNMKKPKEVQLEFLFFCRRDKSRVTALITLFD
jgi:hypothetical protein